MWDFEPDEALVDQIQIHSYFLIGSCGLYAEMMLESDSSFQSGDINVQNSNSLWLMSNPTVDFCDLFLGIKEAE